MPTILKITLDAKEFEKNRKKVIASAKEMQKAVSGAGKISITVPSSDKSDLSELTESVKKIPVAANLRKMNPDKVAEFVETTAEETLSCMDFPYEHWMRPHTNDMSERIMKEIRRRMRVIEAFPDGYSSMMSVGARLRHISTKRTPTVTGAAFPAAGFHSGRFVVPDHNSLSWKGLFSSLLS